MNFDGIKAHLESEYVFAILNLIDDFTLDPIQASYPTGSSEL